MSEYRINEDLQAIMEAVRGHYPEFKAARRAKIICMECDKEKKSSGKTVYADCKKLGGREQTLSGYQFVITFYLDGMVLDEDRMKKLMYHELCHVGYDELTGKCSIIPHDLSDFKAVVRRWGVDWVEDEPGGEELVL